MDADLIGQIELRHAAIADSTADQTAGAWGPAPKAGALETACVKQIDEFAAAVRSERTPVFRCAVGERQHCAQSAIHMNRFKVFVEQDLEIGCGFTQENTVNVTVSS